MNTHHYRQMMIGAILVSTIITIGFAGMCALIFTRAIPAESMDLAKDVAKTMGILEINVVGFWMGTSIGSVQKGAQLQEKQP